jgi:hypothetical protein
VFLDLAAISVGEAHCCSYERIFNSAGACIIWIVAAMASSIYIIGILVSEDKSTRIFYQLMLYENIYSIIRSSTARRGGIAD